ncbi:MAG: hypothetical protein COV08_01180 [Candidatus Vogelbacteria bacterium CG10_big_fil_rev_8_21_14_0_10_49_38]|uniref:DUF192 domain-containing protein n=1 Tax=Candidatus Vogelbacteria bacterium CG10_big_fil_rev_8_21_14_0_10_49_38 TaxID=1975043 RepID=A0A2H0RHX4_9BACT|nr:MAG: hypothetical protein BK006_01200 [bacterium CG10_49_38]PIR46152.1 MAG: hypothetical protein COV08_01180 [Candidatus Vogelbacteria bacterium CG10_big_fil_rev_8_21_14_0_10_49_38]
MKLPRPKSVYLLLALIVCLIGILLHLNRADRSLLESRFFPSSRVMTTPTQNQFAGPALKIRELEIPVELATTSEAIRRGLSGRASLPPEQGMLFVFGRPDRYRFWMPEMRFPLDIIWLNEDKVVGFESNVSNDFDQAQPIFYQPDEPVRLVLEVNAGFVARHGLEIGDPVDLSGLKE